MYISTCLGLNAGMFIMPACLLAKNKEGSCATSVLVHSTLSMRYNYSFFPDLFNGCKKRNLNMAEAVPHVVTDDSPVQKRIYT